MVGVASKKVSPTSIVDATSMNHQTASLRQQAEHEYFTERITQRIG